MFNYSNITFILVDEVLVAYRLETSQFKTESDLKKIKDLFPECNHVVLGSHKDQPQVRLEIDHKHFVVEFKIAILAC